MHRMIPVEQELLVSTEPGSILIIKTVPIAIVYIPSGRNDGFIN